MGLFRRKRVAVDVSVAAVDDDRIQRIESRQARTDEEIQAVRRQIDFVLAEVRALKESAESLEQLPVPRRRADDPPDAPIPPREE